MGGRLIGVRFRSILFVCLFDFKKGFVKGEVFRLLRTKSSKATFDQKVKKFKSRLLNKGYPKTLIETLLSDIKITYLIIGI